MSKEYATVDKVGLAAIHGGKDVGHFLCGVEGALLDGGLLSSGTGAGAAARFFLTDLFHFLKDLNKFAPRKARGGEVSLPLGSQIQISNLILTFQILSEIASLIGSLVFRVSPTSYYGVFGCPLKNHTTKVRNNFELHKRFSKYFRKIFIIFHPKENIWTTSNYMSKSKSDYFFLLAVLSNTVFIFYSYTSAGTREGEYGKALVNLFFTILPERPAARRGPAFERKAQRFTISRQRPSP